MLNAAMTNVTDETSDLTAYMAQLGETARDAARTLALASTETKNAALTATAQAIRARSADILAANAEDMQEAQDHDRSPAFLDRLMLDGIRVERMAQAIEDIVALPDPVGRTTESWVQPSGLNIMRVRVPLGVIGLIYEARPNVTVDAGALCLKSGNAAILRGGSDSFRSAVVLGECLAAGLAAAGLPAGCIQVVDTPDRAAVSHLLGMTDSVDIIIPRGGRSLIERVKAEAKVPVFSHLDGVNHVYVDASADPEKARRVVVNAKMRRVSVCGAAETVLLDSALDVSVQKSILGDLMDSGCSIRGCDKTVALDNRIEVAEPEDWGMEYLAPIISAKIVDGVEAAIAHIARYGSHHTDSIVAEDTEVAATFLRHVDSAIVMHNVSTQFADGGEFGLGAEIGISTGRLHARGPVGLNELTTYKYVVRGDGLVRS